MGLFIGNKLVSPAQIIKEGGGSGKYQLLQRISDDNGNEIGTVSGFFTDANNVKYAVVCLDAQYRATDISPTSYTASKLESITNLPIYSDYHANSAKETATWNTQTILDYCTSKGLAGDGCNFVRSKSFTINGIIYYGQIPNIHELVDIANNWDILENLDITASSYSSLNFSTARSVFSSTQNRSNGQLKYWSGDNGQIGGGASNANKMFICPILEIPLN